MNLDPEVLIRITVLSSSLTSGIFYSKRSKCDVGDWLASHLEAAGFLNNKLTVTSRTQYKSLEFTLSLFQLDKKCKNINFSSCYNKVSALWRQKIEINKTS